MIDGPAVAGDGDIQALRKRIAELEAELEDARRADRAVRRSEELYRRLVELSPDAIYVHDDHRRVVFMNAAGARLFGADSPEQLIGRLATDLVHPESRPSAARHLDRALDRQSTAVQQKQRCLRLDGGDFHADVVATPIDWDDWPAGLVVVRDVSDRIEADARAAAAEDRSREAHARLVDAIDAMSGGFALYDADERLVLCNRRYAESIWPQSSDIIKPGVDFETLVREILRRRAGDSDTEHLVAAALERHRNLPSECEIAYPDGHWMWQSKRRTSDGGVVAVYADITGVKERERLLREREAQLRTLLEALPDAVIIHVDERVVFVNAAAVRMFGADSAEQLLQSYSMQSVPPEFVEFQRARRRKVLEEKCSLAPIEQRRYRLDGSVIDVETASTYMLWEGRPAFVGVMRDVTERMRVAARLRESEERYRKLIDMTPDCIYAHRAGRIVLCNDAAAELFGAGSRDEMLGLSTLDLVHPDFREMVARRQALVVSDGTRTTFMRQKRLRRDGTEFWAEVAAAGVEWDGVRGGIVVLRDVTEQMKAAELLRHSKEEAELASRAKTEFLANVSHELRTPLNAIIGFSDIIQREMFGPLGNENYRSYARDIHQSGTHLHDLINDILDLSKVEAGKLELQEEEVDIARAAERCLRLVQTRAEGGRVALETAIEEPLPPVRADERKMKQIMLNLLSNAVKFTEPGGSVRLNIALAPGGGLEIVVADTGIGMDAEGMKVALQPFGQADSALNRKYEGTGLGLPLTRALVDMHGGGFEIESALGEGTRVTVTLPASRVLSARPPAADGA